MGDTVIYEQTFEYDWLTNITNANDCDCNQNFVYDGNNRLTSYNGCSISYDMDGNMLNTVVNERNIALTFDSANRLIKADGTEYTYTAEDVRIKAVTGDKVTTYTYNTNTRLSQLLVKTTNGVVTKYVYGLGLIGEECNNNFKTYHFDYRGSTTAITDENGNITDTFKYDTYGNIIEHTGTSDTPFLFNGCDGVMTEDSGLIYMRARYYNPEIKRFINADILAGTIDNLPSLNRYAYAEGNPVSNVDPTGLSVEVRGNVDIQSIWNILGQVSSTSDKKMASQMMAKILNEILTYEHFYLSSKDLISASSVFKQNLLIGNSKIAYSSEVGRGDGIFDVSAVYESQINMLGTLNIPVSDNIKLVVDSDKSLGISYSFDINNNTSVDISISGKIDVSLSAEYKITTTDKNKNFIASSFELTHFNNTNSKPNRLPQLETVPSVNTDFSWGLRLAGVGLLVWGLVNNVTGIGFGDDLVTIPAALAMLAG